MVCAAMKLRLNIILLSFGLAIFAAHFLGSGLGSGLGATGISSEIQSVPPQSPDPDAFYKLGPDSLPQDGVPKGEIRGPFTLPSNVYPGTQHTYWVYVPAQYDPAVPAALM